MISYYRKEYTMTGSKRKIVTLYPGFADTHKEKIAASAAEYGFEAVFCDDRETALREALDAEIVLSYDPATAKAGTGVKWVCSPSAGVNHFREPLAGTGIMLTNSAGAHSVTIAEHIIMVTLELMRKRMDYIRLAAQRKWVMDLPVRSIHGARIAMLGTGNIGQETAKRLRAFEPESIVGINRKGMAPDGIFDRIVTIGDIDSILPETDLLIMSLPSTAETKLLFTEERMLRLPAESYIVNVGRGDVLDEKALERILRSGKLAGAALDVFEKEPLDPDSTLWDCPGLVLTTHVAGNWTLPLTVDRITDMFIEDLANYCEGRRLKRLIDLDVGY